MLVWPYPDLVLLWECNHTNLSALAGRVKGSTPRTERETQVCICHQIASYGLMPDPSVLEAVVLIGLPTPWNGVSVHNCKCSTYVREWLNLCGLTSIILFFNFLCL